MNCDWDSEDEEGELVTTSSHIPIEQESKKKYDEWVENECSDRWWDKEIERKETPALNNPFHSDMVKELIATEEGEKTLEDYYDSERESRIRIEKL